MSWKTPITLLVLLAVLLGAGYYGWRTIISPATGNNDKASHASRGAHHHRCVKKGDAARNGQRLVSKDVLVNVYNSGAISGLAGDTLAAMHVRGFLEGVAENAPVGTRASNVTIITADKRAPEVRLVASQFKGRVVFTKGTPLAPGVDVVVGDSYVGVDHKADKFLQLRRHVQTCGHGA